MTPTILWMRRLPLVLLVCGFCLQSAGAIEVNSTGDVVADDGQCTFREAIIAANNNVVSGVSAGECAAGVGTADTISFILTFPAIIHNLLVSFPDITEGLSIVGPGPADLTIVGSHFGRLFHVVTAVQNVDFSGMTLTNGFAQGGAGSINFPQQGGAILVTGSPNLTLTNVVFDGNQSEAYGGAISIRSQSATTINRCTFNNNMTRENGSAYTFNAGGAIFAESGTLTIVDSTFTNNSAMRQGAGPSEDGHGGAIMATGGTLNIARTTFSGNNALGSGSAIAFGIVNTQSTNIMASLEHLTITNNDGDTDSDGFEGAAISRISFQNIGTITITNSIIAANKTGGVIGPDVATGGPGTYTSGGFNLIKRGGLATADFPNGTPNANGDYVGAALLIHLSPLGNRGGPTQTHFPILTPNSNIIDRGFCAGENHDQRIRGATAVGPRIVDRAAFPNINGSDGCDIGAVEHGASTPVL